MNKIFKKIFHYKSFLRKITYLIMFSFVLVIFLFTAITYYSSENLMLEKENEKNDQQMLLVKRNIELMDENVKSTCKSLFSNPDTVSLMYDYFDDDFEGLYRVLSNNNNLTSNNAFIDTVYYSNNYNNEFYNATSGIYHDKNFFKEILKVRKTIPLLKPVILDRKPSGEKMNKNIISYFMYESADKSGNPNGALIINVKSDWLVGNLQQSSIKSQTNDSVFIFSPNGEIFGESSKQETVIESVKKLFAEYKNGGYLISENKNYVKSKVNGIDYIVTFLDVQSAGMIIVKIQKYKELFQIVDRLRLNIVVISLFFILFVVAVSMVLSKSIYKPLGRLISTLKSNKSNISDEDYSDEFAFLNQLFSNSKEKIAGFERDKINSRWKTKCTIIKDLLNKAEMLKQDELDKIFKDNFIGMDLNGKFAVCLLSIDEYNNIEASTSLKNIELIKFAVINIFCEVLSESYIAEGVDMEKDKVAIIINLSLNSRQGAELNFEENTERLIRRATDYVTQYFNINISASLTEFSEKYSDIPGLYLVAFSNSLYRLIFGKKCIIHQSMTKANQENMRHNLSPDLKKNLLEAIMIGDLNAVEEHFNKLLKDASTLSYNNITIALFNLVNTIWECVSKHKIKGLENYQLGFIELGQRIFEIETIDDYYSSVMTLLEQLFEKNSAGINNEKHRLISENIKELIHQNYANKNLCLAEIAATVKISTPYVGRIFKEEIGMSVSEYINEVRLERAASLLVESGLTVIEILERIGVENEKHFYTLFKKKFGNTPKEYALNLLLNQGINLRN